MRKLSISRTYLVLTLLFTPLLIYQNCSNVSTSFVGASPNGPQESNAIDDSSRLEIVGKVADQLGVDPGPYGYLDANFANSGSNELLYAHNQSSVELVDQFKFAVGTMSSKRLFSSLAYNCLGPRDVSPGIYTYCTLDPNGNRVLRVFNENENSDRRVSPENTNLDSFLLSPDKQKLLMVARPIGSVLLPRRLFVANFDGTDVRDLTSSFSATQSVQSLSIFRNPFSANLERVVFSVSGDLSDSLYSIKLNGTGLVRIDLPTADGSGLVGLENTFLVCPSLNRVIYSAQKSTSSLKRLYSVNLDGSGHTQLTGDDEELASGVIYFSDNKAVASNQVSVSSDCSEIVYLANSHTSGTTYVRSVHADRSGSRTLAQSESGKPIDMYAYSDVLRAIILKAADSAGAYLTVVDSDGVSRVFGDAVNKLSGVSIAIDPKSKKQGLVQYSELQSSGIVGRKLKYFNFELKTTVDLPLTKVILDKSSIHWNIDGNIFFIGFEEVSAGVYVHRIYKYSPARNTIKVLYSGVQGRPIFNLRRSADNRYFLFKSNFERSEMFSLYLARYQQ